MIKKNAPKMNIKSCLKAANNAGLKDSELNDLMCIAKNASEIGGQLLTSNQTYSDVFSVSFKFFSMFNTF